MEANSSAHTKTDAAVEHGDRDKLTPVSFDAEALFWAVQARRSVRTFNGSPPRAEHLALIRDYLNAPKNMTGPLYYETIPRSLISHRPGSRYPPAATDPNF